MDRNQIRTEHKRIRNNFPNNSIDHKMITQSLTQNERINKLVFIADKGMQISDSEMKLVLLIAPSGPLLCYLTFNYVGGNTYTGIGGGGETTPPPS